MIKIHFIRHHIREGLYKELMYYYMDLSPTVLFNYFNDKGKVKYWADGRIVLDTPSKDYEIILEVTEIKTIGLEELSDRIGV